MPPPTRQVYKSSVKGNVQGSDTVVIPTDGVVVCLDREPKAQLVTAVVEVSDLQVGYHVSKSVSAKRRGGETFVFLCFCV